MTAQQKRIAAAYRVRSYYGMGGLGGDARPITQAIGAGLLSAGGIIAAIPGGQLPGAIVAAVGALTGLIGGLFAPDLTKIQATHIVDQIEAQVLKPMLANWQALPANQKTQTNQAAFLEVFDAAWRKVQEGCSNPALGSAGVACIADRVRGGRWPWPEYYRDPISSDPNVIPDPSFGGTVGGSIDSAVTGFSSTLGVSPMVLGIGLIAFGLLAVSD
jgi:hypothetical protein